MTLQIEMHKANVAPWKHSRAKVQCQCGGDVGECIVVDVRMIFVGSHDAVDVVTICRCVVRKTALPKLRRSDCQFAADIFQPIEIVRCKEVLAQRMGYVGRYVLLVNINLCELLQRDIASSVSRLPRKSVDEDTEKKSLEICTFTDVHPIARTDLKPLCPDLFALSLAAFRIKKR